MSEIVESFPLEIEVLEKEHDIEYGMRTNWFGSEDGTINVLLSINSPNLLVTVAGKKFVIPVEKIVESIKKKVE